MNTCTTTSNMSSLTNALDLYFIFISINKHIYTKKYCLYASSVPIISSTQDTQIRLNRWFLPRSEQLNGAHANEIKHDHSPVAIVLVDPRYHESYKALYIYSRSIALTRQLKFHWIYIRNVFLKFRVIDGEFEYIVKISRGVVKHEGIIKSSGKRDRYNPFGLIENTFFYLKRIIASRLPLDFISPG